LDPQLILLERQSDLLTGILAANVVGLLGILFVAITASKALKQSQERLERLLNEWEPRLIQMEADFKKLHEEALRSLDQSQTSMTQIQSILTRADATMDDLAPKIERMTSDAEQLVLQVRHGVHEFQQTVMPKFRAVSGVAGALRDGFGIFQQLQKSRPQDRR
jgi:gas vesicle protein